MDRMENDEEQGTGSVVAVMETVLLLVTICVALVIGWRIDKKLQQRHSERRQAQRNRWYENLDGVYNDKYTKRGGRHRL